MLHQTHLPKALTTVACLPLLALQSCGDKAGDNPGKDPRVPIQLIPKTPEPSASPQSPDGQKADSPSPDKSNDPQQNKGDTARPVDGQPDAPPPPSSSPTQPKGVALTIDISGLNSEKGNLCLSMFNSPDGYPDSASKAVLAECFSVIGRAFSLTIENVLPGRYAIAMWHDENRDGKLNYNFLGIPKEGLAFSENGKPRITPPPPGPPSFNAVSFEVKDTPKSTPAKMSYLLDLL
jgi:uncharacterized protein (DUF2141 family)